MNHVVGACGGPTRLGRFWARLPVALKSGAGIGLLLTVLLIAEGGATLHESRGHLLDLVEERLIREAHDAAEQFAVNVAQLSAMAALVGTRLQLTETLDALRRGALPRDAAREIVVRNLAVAVTALPAGTRVRVLDARGAAVDRDSPGETAAVPACGSFVMAPPVPGPGVRHAVFTVPFCLAGKRAGAAVLAFDARYLEQGVTARAGLGRRGWAVARKRMPAGTAVYVGDAARLQSLAPEVRERVLEGYDRPRHAWIAADRPGGPALVARVPVPGSDWTVIAAVDASAALAFGGKLRKDLMAAGALHVLIGVLLAALLAQRFVAPVVAVARAAHRAADGDLTSRTGIRREDEIGDLAASLDTLTERLSMQLAEREVVIAERTHELEAFSYSVSHDLRAPLRHIDGFAELLEKRAGAALDETSRRYVATMRGSARHMGEMIDALLLLSRTGSADLRDGRVALAPLVDEVVGDLLAAGPAARVTWSIGPLPEVHGDPALLRAVLINLLDNAVKFSRDAPEPRVAVSCETLPSEWVLTVADNGAGFDMRCADRLFGAFQRLHLPEQFPGHGIGLAQVRRIVSKHGGRVWAEGEPGRGARFHVSLPRPEDDRR